MAGHGCDRAERASDPARDGAESPASVVAGLVIDKNFFTLLLSYCPGGIYEVAVIAIFFDLDPEFVSFHHIIRLLMILFTVPVILKIISKKA